MVMAEAAEEKKEKVDAVPAERLAELENKWKRAVADYRNLEKRVAKEQAEFAQFANFVLISKLLPVVDDLEEAQRQSGDEGLQKILQKLEGLLTGEGVSEIPALGKEFDPGVMEGQRSPDPSTGALAKVEALAEGEAPAKGEESRIANQELRMKVTEVVRKGYLLHGRLLRPARVKVAAEAVSIK